MEQKGENDNGHVSRIAIILKELRRLLKKVDKEGALRYGWIPGEFLTAFLGELQDPIKQASVDVFTCGYYKPMYACRCGMCVEKLMNDSNDDSFYLFSFM